MPGYRVYYRKEPTFRVDPDLTKDGVLRSGKFAYIAQPNFSLGPNPMEELFLKFQGEMMPWPIKVATQKAGVHTSMSVGDVLEEVDTGRMFQCGDPVGWVPIPVRRKKKS